jgi:hypothetical protein
LNNVSQARQVWGKAAAVPNSTAAHQETAKAGGSLSPSDRGGRVSPDVSR